VYTVERHADETDVDLIEPHGVGDRIAPTRWGVGGGLSRAPSAPDAVFSRCHPGRLPLQHRVEAQRVTLPLRSLAGLGQEHLDCEPLLCKKGASCLSPRSYARAPTLGAHIQRADIAGC
jgi:hypothetical protein